jgi:hypothetical protein
MGIVKDLGDRGNAKPVYIFFEDVMAALAKMRVKNTAGYLLHVPDGWGFLLPTVRVQGSGWNNNWRDEEPAGRTNCTGATLNAFAVALSAGSTVTNDGGKEYSWAALADGTMPDDFTSMWMVNTVRTTQGKIGEREVEEEVPDPDHPGQKKKQKKKEDVMGPVIDRAASSPHWFRGSARAVQKYNAGCYVVTQHVRRGDVMQINWHDWDQDTQASQLEGHSVFCWHARRIDKNKTRFLFVSAQTETFGVGIRMSALGRVADLARRHPNVLEERWKALKDKVWGHSALTLEPFSFALEGDLEYVEAALRYGHWYVVNGVKDDAGTSPVNQIGGGFHKLHAARPHRPFPCVPLRLAKGLSPAIDDELTYARFSGGRGFSTFFNTRYQNNERGPDGFYPIGAGRVWHGGVHLRPTGGEKTVHAALDGRVVCARFAAPDEEKWQLGSPNFVLLRHSLKLDKDKHTFYSLYMHLGYEAPPEPGKPDPRLRYPWLRDLVLAPAKGSFEATKLDYKKLYLRATAPGKLGKDVDLAPGDFIELTDDQLALWYGLQGTAKEVTKVGGGKGSIDLDALAARIEPYDPFPVWFTEEKDQLDNGKVVDLWDKGIVVRAGEPIGIVGKLGDKELIHFEIFSKDVIPKDWPKKIESHDASLLFDRQKFCKEFFKMLEQAAPELKSVPEHMVDDTARRGEGVIQREEVIHFFNTCDTKALRDVAAIFPSEWGDSVKWDKLAEQGKEAFGYMKDELEKFGNKFAPYVWWNRDIKGLDDGVSKDAVVHYNPIRFLQWIDELRSKEAASGTSDLHDSVIDLNHTLEDLP